MHQPYRDPIDFGGDRTFGVLEPAQAAWNRLRQDFAGVWLPLFVVMLITFVISGVFGGVRGVLEAVASESRDPTALKAIAALVQLVEGIVNMCVGAFFASGIVVFTLKVWRRETYQLSDVFSGGRYFFQMLLTNLLVSLCSAAGCCLLIVPGIYLALSFALAPYFVVDHEMDVISAMKASWREMDGLRVSLFGFVVVFCLLAIVPILITCGLGLLLVNPLGSLALTYVYLRAVRGGPSATANVDPQVFS